MLSPRNDFAAVPGRATTATTNQVSDKDKRIAEMNSNLDRTTDTSQNSGDDNPQKKIVPCPVPWCVRTAGCSDHEDAEASDPRTRMHESKASNLEGCGYLTTVQTGDTGTATGYVELRIVTGTAGFSSDGLRAHADKFERIANEFRLTAAGVDLITADAIARICDGDNSSAQARELYTVPPVGSDTTSTTATSGIAPCPSWCVVDEIDHSDPHTRLHQSGGGTVKDIAFLCIVQEGDSAETAVHLELGLTREEAGHTPEQARTRSDELKHIAAELAAYADCVEEINADNSASSDRA
jgi:hypothetical protein